jgi:hypothetical protein
VNHVPQTASRAEFFSSLLEIQIGIYIAALRADITAFINHHNADPKPFRWVRSANDILAAVERFCRYSAPR